MGKRKRKKKFHHDDKGQFRWETYFVGGQQKRHKVRTVDGIDADEFWRQNADPIVLLQAGEYDLLHEWETRMNQNADSKSDSSEDTESIDDEEIDLPF